ncbi:MAG TPA: branched-chain amino acid ABC transporter permease, partial [Actinomycetota bacterium]|nr:branched-chain amino acid ABC transporter permease [Actinomycetota bacterium]
GIYGLLAVGLVLVYKGTRALNFAQGELGTFGLYIAWVFTHDDRMPWFVGALAAMAIVGLIGWLFERFVVRNMIQASRLAVAVATIGLFFLLFSIEIKVWGVSPKVVAPPLEGLGPKLAGFHVSPTYMLAFAAVAIMGVALAAFLRKTDFGLGVVAASQDPVAVRLMGIPLNKVSSFTWVTASVIGVIAGLLIEPSIGAFAPGFMTPLFVNGLAAALLGGLTSLPGAFLGGAAIGVLESLVKYFFLGSLFPGISVLAVFMVIITVLLLRPQGILGKAEA